MKKSIIALLCLILLSIVMFSSRVNAKAQAIACPDGYRTYTGFDLSVEDFYNDQYIIATCDCGMLYAISFSEICSE